MKFGKLESVSDIDFTLPAEYERNATVLGEKPYTTGIWMGGTMWNLPQWKGKIYPLKAAQKTFLHHYSSQFNTIELNATHYKIPSVETAKLWLNEVPDHFQFCPKFPQSISHYRRFQNCQESSDSFLEVLDVLRTKRGPSFIQLPPNYSRQKAEILFQYLEQLPRDIRVAIEFRHPDWFDGSNDAAMLWKQLEDWGIGAVLSDTAGRRDAVHMRLTAKFFVLSFGGNNLDQSDYPRLDAWAEKLHNWSQLGLEDFYLWMHQTDSVLTPESCIYFADKASKLMKRSIDKPTILNEGKSLLLF
jgi:uncharacterized protein YecE (DUF72 family)